MLSFIFMFVSAEARKLSVFSGAFVVVYLLVDRDDEEEERDELTPEDLLGEYDRDELTLEERLDEELDELR